MTARDRKERVRAVCECESLCKCVRVLNDGMRLRYGPNRGAGGRAKRRMRVTIREVENLKPSVCAGHVCLVRVCAMPKARGVAFARYLRKVHIEWSPFKPKAVGPIFFQEMHTKKIMEATPKLTISKALHQSAPVNIAAAASDALPAYTDRTTLTFADGTEKMLDFDGIKLGDILDEIEMENVRIQRLERERGRPF